MNNRAKSQHTSIARPRESGAAGLCSILSATSLGTGQATSNRLRKSLANHGPALATKSGLNRAQGIMICLGWLRLFLAIVSESYKPPTRKGFRRAA